MGRLKPDTIYTLPPQPVPYAVLGSPINHSLSPVMQQAAFDHAGLCARYFRVEVDEEGLEVAVARMRQVPFGGWNCTVPNKLRMYDLCDRRAESAELFRAVNVVVNRDGVLTGHNTDGTGFSRALVEAFGPGMSDLRILLLGAGGAGRAIATQAVLERCPLLLLANRKRQRAVELLEHLERQFTNRPGVLDQRVRIVDWTEDELEKALREVDLVVNATSAGLDAAAPVLLPARMIPPSLLVFDTIYGAGCLKLKTEVALAGASWSDGLGLLLHQGAASFALWTGRDAPLDIMREALKSSIPA